MISIACKTKVLEQHNLKLEVFKGSLSLEHLFEFKKEDALKLNFLKPYNVLCDIRELQIGGLTDELMQLSIFLKKNGELDLNRKSAVVVSTPNQHIYANIFSKLNGGLSNQIKVFLSVKDALKWLKCDAPLADIELKLHRMGEKTKIIL